MRKASRLTVFLCLAMPLCAWGQGGRFRKIFIGEPASALPFTCDIVCEGTYQSTWVSLTLTEEKVTIIDVVYSGTGFRKKIIASPLPTLGQAVKVHSLQPGFAKPRFGFARDRDGIVYGVVDIANRIIYTVIDSASIGPESSARLVSYVDETAPVLRWGEERPLNDKENAELLEAAERMPPYTVGVTVLDEEAELKASTHEEALDKLEAQGDVVIGKGKRTLALIKALETWYEVDKDHPDAIAKSKELRQFYPDYQKEYDKLFRIINLNKQLWRSENEATDVLAEDPELGDLRKDIERQMRRLTAMGFEL